MTRPKEADGQYLAYPHFLSSPGHVNDERQIALEAIERSPNRPAFREQETFRVIAFD